MDLTQITETLYALPVPIDASDIYHSALRFICAKNPKRMVLYNHVVDFKLKIIGTVTQEEIDFGSVTIQNLSKSIEYMVHSGITAFGEMKYYDYCITDFVLDSAEDSFRSLLASKGINPTPETKLLIIENV